MVPVLAVCVLAGGCLFPEYYHYTSPASDFVCDVPYGWSVKTDSEGDHFSNITFIGGFDPEFYLGAPSFSVRWHSADRIHKLPNGLLEMYSNEDDYIGQMLRSVYGPAEGKDYWMDTGTNEDPKGIRSINLKAANLPAKFFVVVSPTEVPSNWTWGIVVNKKDQSRNMLIRKHAYALVRMQGGFYSIIYPGTREGYAKYEKQFRVLLGTFKPLKNGPGGSPVTVSKSSR